MVSKKPRWRGPQLLLLAAAALGLPLQGAVLGLELAQLGADAAALRRYLLAEEEEAAAFAAHRAILAAQPGELRADALGCLCGPRIATASSLQALKLRPPRLAGCGLGSGRSAHGRQRQQSHAEASGNSQHHRKSGHVIHLSEQAIRP